MKLDDIIDLKVLQKIQDYFSRATGFAAVTVDYRGRPLLEYSWFCKFCTRLRKDPILNEKCCQSDAHGSLEAVRRNGIYIYKCHAGLIDIAIPIIVEGEYVASMLCGQVRAEESTIFKDDIITPTHNLFADNPGLEDEFNRIITVPDDRIEGTANLLNITLKYIVDQYLLNQRNMKLLQDRMEHADMKKQIKDLEFKNYHPQINPPFLFSMMNVAGRQAYLENAQKTQDIIFTMADMYRSHLNYSGQLITVEREKRNLNNYIFIQEARFGDQISFSINFSENIMQYSLPAMTLQIFVENAVIHGFEPKEGSVKVSILGEEKDGKMEFEIVDDGVGMPQKYLDILNNYDSMENRVPESFGIGIYYTLKRLHYFYEDGFTVRFFSDSKTGSRVFLSLPIDVWSEDST